MKARKAIHVYGTLPMLLILISTILIEAAVFASVTGVRSKPQNTVKLSRKE